MGFDGLRVLSLESRRANEIATLIKNQGGVPFVAPSMREADLDQNEAAFAFADRLFAGEFDMMILLTGVGVRGLHKLLATRHPESRFAEALSRLCVVCRGPKPIAACRDLKIPVTVTVPEPNTWRELLEAIKDRPEKHIAVQEYGRSNEELIAALRGRGADVTCVRVYHWALPIDISPLRDAVRKLACDEFDVAMFTTSIQIPHMLQIACEEGIEDAVREKLQRSIVVASIGPTCSETLTEHGIPTDLMPSHPKMGFLVKETAERAGELLRSKRGV